MNRQHIHSSFSFIHCPGRDGGPDHWRVVGGIVIGVSSERREFDFTIVEVADGNRIDRFIVHGREHECYTSAKEAMWCMLKDTFKDIKDKPEEVK